jgi:hypothetical protein
MDKFALRFIRSTRVWVVVSCGRTGAKIPGRLVRGRMKRDGRECEIRGKRKRDVGV